MASRAFIESLEDFSKGTLLPRRVAPGDAPRPDMVWIPGGVFRMGCDDAYPEERPQHRAEVGGFWMDRYPVSNARFARIRRGHAVT